MKIIVTILEDAKIEQEKISNILDSWALEKDFQIEKKVYDSGESYLKAVSTLNDPSNLFVLDIQLRDISGIEIAKTLRKAGYAGQIIFLTAFKEYVFNGYEVHALNFLLKPVDPKALYLCLDEIADTLMGHAYHFRNKQETFNIPYKEIICFSSSRHYIDILTTNGLFTQYATLNSVLGFLPSKFIRVHKSHIVNLAHIYKICGSVITLSNQMTIEIGPSYLKQVYSDFSDYSSRFDVT